MIVTKLLRASARACLFPLISVGKKKHQGAVSTKYQNLILNEGWTLCYV